MAGTDRGAKFNILVFTLIETATVASLALIGAPLVLVPVLVLGFMAEHIVSYNAKHIGRSLFELDGLPIPELIAVATFEAVTWFAWFVLTGSRPFVAVAVLAVGLLIGHILERNTVADLPLLRDPIRRIRESLDFTGVETATGIVWRLLLPTNRLLAAAILATGLFVEHKTSFARPVRGA